MEHYTINEKQIVLKDTRVITVRPAVKADAEIMTEIIKNAFTKHWNNRGYFVKPSIQTIQQTETYLDKSFVALNNQNEIVGTFGLDSGSLNFSETGIVEFYQGNKPPVPFIKKNVSLDSIKSKIGYLAFYKLAVREDYEGIGLASALYNCAENFAKQSNLKGMILETSNLLPFLFTWYLKLGFEVIGGYTYPDSQIETLLLIKPF